MNCVRLPYRLVSAVAVLVMASSMVNPAACAADAETLAKCQQSLGKQTQRYFTARMTRISDCVRQSLSCLQNPPCTKSRLKCTELELACKKKSAGRCEKQFATIERNRAAFVRPLQACDVVDGEPVVPFDDAAYAVTKAECADLGVVLSDAASLQGCLAMALDRTSERLLGFQIPRAAEVINFTHPATCPLRDLPIIAGCGDCKAPVDQRAAVGRCGRAASEAGNVFAKIAGGALGDCAAKLARCQSDKCFDAARTKCIKALQKAAGAADVLEQTLNGFCGPGALSYETLRGESGLNVDALTCVCEDVSLPTPDSFGSYARCFRRRHECELAKFLRLSHPELPARLEAQGLSLASALCPALAPPATPVAAAARFPGLRRFFDLTKGRFGNGVTRTPFFKPGGARLPTPGKRPGVTGIIGTRGFFGGLTKTIRAKYSLARSADGRSGLDGERAIGDATLLVAVRRLDGTIVDGDAFELILEPGQDAVDLDFEFPLDVQECRFTLVFAVAVDGEVSEYTPFELVRESASGITFTGRSATVAKGALFESMAISPDGLHLYATTLASKLVTVVERDPSSGSLTVLQNVIDDVAGVDGMGLPTAITVSPDGLDVYVVGDGLRDKRGLPVAGAEAAIVRFRRDPSSGQLAFVEAVRFDVAGVTGPDAAKAVVVSPDGKHVYVAGGKRRAAFFPRPPAGIVVLVRVIGVFARDSATGALTFVQEINERIEAQGIAISPDGSHVYTTGQGEVVAYARNATAGTLALVARSPGDLNGARGIAVNPDGDQVYVASTVDDALTVFDRDATTGVLSERQVMLGGPCSAIGLDGAAAIAVSADAKRVYVAGSSGGTVSAFERDATGTLIFGDLETEGVDGVGGLGGVVSLTASADGRHVYAGSTLSPGATIFHVDP